MGTDEVVLELLRCCVAAAPLLFVAFYAFWFRGWHRTREGRWLMGVHLASGLILLLGAVVGPLGHRWVDWPGRPWVLGLINVVVLIVFTSSLRLLWLARREGGR